MKKAAPLDQASDLQIVSDVFSVVLRKGRGACQFVYDSLGMCSPSAAPFERTDRCSAHLLHPPATTLIINISNSTLVDCSVGNGLLPAVVEKQPLLGVYAPLSHQSARCSCFSCHGVAAQPPVPPPPATIHVHSSTLNCVIIGDNNYMHVDQTH